MKKLHANDNNNENYLGNELGDKAFYPIASALLYNTFWIEIYKHLGMLWTFLERQTYAQRVSPSCTDEKARKSQLYWQKGA